MHYLVSGLGLVGSAATASSFPASLSTEAGQRWLPVSPSSLPLPYPPQVPPPLCQGEGALSPPHLEEGEPNFEGFPV